MYKIGNAAKRIFMIFCTFVIVLSDGMTVYSIDGNTLEQTGEKMKTAETQFKNAENSYKEAVAEVSKTEKELAEAKKTLFGLEDKDLDKKVISNYSKWQNSIDDMDKKENIYNELQQKAEESLVEYNKGTFGFFEYVGAEDALDALKNSKYASYTHQGSKNDATNLDNMKDSFDFIRKCNELRQKEQNDPETKEKLAVLEVNDYLMAAAQADANYSLLNPEHAHQFNIGENIAWGYTEPFSAWYDKEKEDYLSGNSEFDETGHYKNILNSEYFTTGFAVAKGGSYGVEQLQTFYWKTENSMSVDDYEARFMEYYSKVTEEYNKLKPSLEKAEKDFEDAKAEAEKNENEYNNSVSERDRAKTEISSKKQEISSLESSLSDSRNKVSELKKAMDEKEKTYKSLKSEYESLKTRYEREQSAISKEESMKNGVSNAVSKVSSDVNSEQSISEISEVSEISKTPDQSKTEISDTVTESRQSAEASERKTETSFNWSEINDQTGINTAGMIVAVAAFVAVGVLCIVFLRIRR